MSIPVLRDYQERDVDRIRRVLRTGKRAPLYVAPCGAGKTVLFSHIAMTVQKRGHAVVILCHRAELIDQISTALTAFGVEHGFIAAGYPFIRGHSVYVASVFTMVRRLELFHPDFIIVDEAHHTAASTWEQILKASSKAFVLGVTATPCRKTGSLASFYDEIIIGPSYEELTNAGFLTPLEIFAPPTISVAGLHSRAGEFIPTEVALRTDKPSVTGDAIDHYRRICPGKRAAVFDINVEVARKRAEAFRAAGFTAEAIDGTLSREVRAMAVAGFREGRIQILTSVSLVTEGFDLPAVEVGIDLSPTQSLATYIQRAGRLLRPMAGKSVATLFDHARNVERFGFPTESRVWSLDGVTEGTNSGQSERSSRTCPSCYAVNRPGARTCKACGKAFPIEGRHVPQKKGELKKLTPEDARALAEKRRLQREGKITQAFARTETQLVALGRQRGMKNPEGWAKHIIQARSARGRG
jgi:DNA repair protein RadD